MAFENIRKAQQKWNRSENERDDCRDFIQVLFADPELSPVVSYVFYRLLALYELVADEGDEQVLLTDPNVISSQIPPESLQGYLESLLEFKSGAEEVELGYVLENDIVDMIDEVDYQVLTDEIFDKPEDIPAHIVFSRQIWMDADRGDHEADLEFLQVLVDDGIRGSIRGKRILQSLTETLDIITTAPRGVVAYLRSVLVIDEGNQFYYIKGKDIYLDELMSEIDDEFFSE